MLDSTPTRRTRRSRDEWQALISDCKKSGLNPREYCQQNHLSQHRFNTWQRRLDATTLDGMFIEVPQEVSTPSSWVIELTIGDLTLKLRR
jgi:hypothetical protein